MSSEQIIQQAANWLTRLHDEDVSDTDRQFNAWCQADPRHRVAIERMRSLGQPRHLAGATGADCLEPRIRPATRARCPGGGLARRIAVWLVGP